MIYVGTSGWQYRSWRGRFYPEGVPQRHWLQHYSSRFRVVEVNNSFYVLPKEETFARWANDTPGDFVFVVKASRYITHIRRLRNAKGSVDLFWSRVTGLGRKLGPVLFQLPPNLRADPPLLRDFLSELPGAKRAAFEFRDDSWRDDEVLGLLDDAGAAWVLADRPGVRVPLIVTGGWSYLRFHQGRATHPSYSRRKLATWADRMAGLPAKEQFAFLNNDSLAAAPHNAGVLSDLLEQRGLEVATVGP